MTMNAADVLRLYNALQNQNIEIWIDGGWGVDALLEKQTRTHTDLDIVIQQRDVVKLRTLLESQGYQEIKLDIARPHNFVLADNHGHEVDVHVIVLGTHGHRGIKRAILGSVAERVVRHAPCSVLVVRHHA